MTEHPNNFSQKYRIQYAGEFSAILKNGQYVGQKYLLGFCVKNNFSYFRLGISIGKKFGCAEKRNHLKRLIREAFRQNPLRYSLGVDLVILTSKKYKTLEWEYIKKDMQNILSRAFQVMQTT